ncbi:cell wall-active antibiotics response protein LiaF [Halalkalibacillus halophilus]|uniref:cell wall-active antibiotics response protein LiaF n=1 Tax=Halalkalibacillus halophilus TaxID=392827 RepID=UPI00040F5446|nr:cell wall-active antibiotics response protein LiaF [Halalkalibacillus halophilus]
MLDKINSEIIKAIIVISIILVVIEIILFDGGLVVSLGISAILIYLGYQRYERKSGKILFWVGVVMATISILNMMVVKFILIAIIGYFIYYYYESRRRPQSIRPDFSYNENNSHQSNPEFFQRNSSLFSQSLFSHQQTPNKPYPWKDIHIIGVFGERTVDLTEAFLPEGDAIISIRHGLGNIQVLVPYEIEVSVHHSTLLGEVTLFNERLGRVVNETILYQTDGFDTGTARIKIMTSLLFGRMEVVRT